jgi:hypothetical protein
VFEPPEEQFDLPVVTIKLGDDSRAEFPLIGPEGQAPRMLKVVKADKAKQVRANAWGVGAVKSDGLVGAQVGGAIYGAGRGDVVAHIRAISDNKNAPESAIRLRRRKSM